MGSLWRSEEMQLIQLFVQVEAAHDTVHELGSLGCIQFRDLNPEMSAFQRHFVNDVKRLDEMQRKLRYFEEQVTKEKREMMKEFRENPAVDVEGLPAPLKKLEENAEETKPAVNIDELESHYDELEKEIQQLSANHEMLNRNYNSLNTNMFLPRTLHSSTKDQKLHNFLMLLILQVCWMKEQLFPKQLKLVL